MQENERQLNPSEAVDALKQASALVRQAAGSRHAAFASPSPSSSEDQVRRNVKQIQGLLDISLSLLRV